MTTTNKALATPANGSNVNDWDVPVNANWNAIDAAFGGLTDLNVTTVSGTVILNATQYTPPTIAIGGTLTSNVTYEFPTGVGGVWSVVNETTGAFTLTLSSGGGGATVVLKQGFTTPVYSDGTNVEMQSTLPASPAGSNQQVQYNSGGSLAGSANFTFDGTNVAINGTLTCLFLSPLGSYLTPLNVEANAQTAPVSVTFSPTAMTVNCALSNIFSTVFTANVTTAPAITNAHDGQTINWVIFQDSSGARTMTWPVSFKWPGGVAGVLSTAPNAVDIVVASYLASTGNWYTSLLKGFA